MRRTTAQAEVACDRMVTRRKGTVTNVPQQRNSRAITPERRYHLNSTAIWWAPRAGRGLLSSAQFRFMQAEHATGGLCGAGDEPELRVVLGLIEAGNIDGARSAAWAEVKRVAARGLRDAPDGILAQDPR